MKSREFIEILPEMVRQELPPEFSDFQVIGTMSTLIKLSYSVPSVHYEVWIRRRMKQLEVGLDFEGDGESNSVYLEMLGQRSTDIRSALGDAVELEEWDRGWTRVHQTMPLEPLDDDFLVEVSFTLSGMIRTLEPLVRTFDGP